MESFHCNGLKLIIRNWSSYSDDGKISVDDEIANAVCMVAMCWIQKLLFKFAPNEQIILCLPYYGIPDPLVTAQSVLIKGGVLYLRVVLYAFYAAGTITMSR